jgi:outer membrane protein OmpA-like peptidoglycan-associated protein
MYESTVSGPSHHPKLVRFTITATNTHEVSATLQPAEAMANVMFTVTDVDGTPIAATARVPASEIVISIESDGVGGQSIPAGSHQFIVSAPGYGIERRLVNANEGATANMDVVLRSARVRMTESQIVILDRIYFEFDSAVIKRESFDLLDEVVVSMLDNPEIVLIEVQGHTDTQGTSGYNAKLSQARAESVMSYLASRGVEGSRIIATGYGEDRPIQLGSSREVHESNRRVEFHILDRERH